MANKMMNINFDDGFKEISINNDTDRVIRWNPSDVNFMDKYHSFMKWFTEDYEDIIANLDVDNFGSLEDFKQGEVTKVGEILNEKLDELFGDKVSEKAFQGANPITPTGSGKLMFISFIEALLPEIEKSAKAYKVASNKYTKLANDHKKKLGK